MKQPPEEGAHGETEAPGASGSDARRLRRRAALGDLAAGVVHETRNLVTALRGFAQVGLDRLDDPRELARILRTIESESERAAEALSGFLGFARGAGAGTGRLDVNELVNQAARLVRHRLSLDRVQLSLELGDPVPAIRGDGAELQQVLVNLALNARDAMPGGGELRVRTTAGAGEAVIVVEDSGDGVDPGLRDQIFEPYFSTKAEGEGAGLGLSMARRIVGEHRGTIDVASAEHGGAVFTLRIPAAEETVG